MKKTFCFSAFFCLAFFGFVSCASLKSKESSGEVKISMVGNPSAGYSWEFSASPKEIISVRENVEYLGADGIVGAPSRFDFFLSPVKDGAARLDFVYSRSFEDNEPAEKSSYEIEVKNHKIYIKSDFAGKWLLEKFVKDDEEQNFFAVDLGMDKKNENEYSIYGSAGVNVFSGGITIEGNSGKSPNGFALTKMLGAPEEMEFEQNYISLFNSAVEMSTFVRNGKKTLLIVNAEKNLCAQYAAAE